MNQFTLLGNLTKDVELKIAGETSIAETSIAVPRKYKNKKTGEYDTDFFRLKAFGKTAEFMANYLGKGQKVLVQGRIQNNNYEKDGKTIYNDERVVEDVYFAGGNKQSEEAEEPAERETSF